MDQQLTALLALPKEPSMSPSTNIRLLTVSCNSSSGDPAPPASNGHLQSHAQIHTDTYTSFKK